jgi:hypothetical protein
MNTRDLKKGLPKEPGFDEGVIGKDKGAEEAFFEVSKVVESPEMLNGWIEWFKRLNIPCFVTKKAGGYTLWRKGEEVGRPRAKAEGLRMKDIVYAFGV